MRGRLRTEQRGATVLEFALVLPVFLGVAGLVLFGAWLGVSKAILDHGAREGAKYAAMPSSVDLRSYPGDAEVTAEIERSTPLLSPTGVTVLSGAGGQSRNAPFTVRVSYQVPNPLFPLFAPLRLFGVDGISGTLTITSEAEGRRE
jgi:Flp pilus assembly protein TadG